MNTRGLTCLAAAGIGLAAMTGCGTHPASSGSATSNVSTTSTATPPTVVPTAAALVKQMRATIAKATSFKAAGTVTVDTSDFQTDSGSGDSGGSPATTPTDSPTSQASTVNVEASGTLDGSNFYLKSSHDSGTSTAMYLDGKRYFRGDKGFLEDQGWISYDVASGESSHASPFLKYADKWVVSDLSGQIPAPDGISESRTMKRLLEETVSAKVIPDSTVATFTVTPIVDDGVSAYRLQHGDTELVVAADSAATLRLVAVGDSFQSQKLRFSEWNRVPKLTAPSGAIPSSQIPDWPYADDGEGESVDGSTGSEPAPSYSDYLPDSGDSGQPWAAATSSGSAD